MVKGQKKMIGTSTHSQHKKSRPDFALLHIQEIQKLGEQKASGTTIRIYMALCAYAMNGSFCFPNYQTIAEIAGLQSKTFQQIVSRSLSWLSDRDFIEKSTNKKSKYRYFLSFRNTILSEKKNISSENDLSKANLVSDSTQKQPFGNIKKQTSDSDDLRTTITINMDLESKISRSSVLNKSANLSSKKLNKSANIKDKQEKIISIPPLTPPKGGEDINKEKFQLENRDIVVLKKEGALKNIVTTHHTKKYLLTNPSSIMSRCMGRNMIFKEEIAYTTETNQTCKNNLSIEEKSQINKKAQRCFDHKIAQQLPLNIEDIQVLQRAMEEETQWYNWITGFHFTYFKSIMGYSPTDEEIKQAQSNWLKLEENKQSQHRSEAEKERIRLRNQKIEQQLGMSQVEGPPKEKETPKSTKKRTERKPRKRNRTQYRKKHHQRYNNFDGGISHPEYWPVRPAVEKMVSDLIVQKQAPDAQESLYIRTYAEQNNEWFHWLRFHQSRIFEQVFDCQVTDEQQEQSHQIWNRITLQNLGLEFSQNFAKMK